MLMTFNHGMAVKLRGLRGEMNAVAQALHGLGRFGGVLGVGHPEQVLFFVIGRVCWACACVTAMATTLSLPRTGSAVAPTASRNASASLVQKRKQMEISREREASKGREAIQFSYCLFACHTETSPRLEYRN
jgi:hypothetical protein